jgi:lipoprotein-anchoring transpeptidase ErfK/SrfK
MVAPVSAISRRAVIRDAAVLGAAFLLAGCTTEGGGNGQALVRPVVATAPPPPPGLDPEYALMYGPIEGDRFPIPAIDLTRINPAFLRREVDFSSAEAPGTIIVDPAAHYLYYVQPGGRAIRYGVGVGKQGFSWTGTATVNSKQEWPDWYPPPEMIERRPDLKPQLTDLQSGRGVAGGPRNPLGARALYLWQNNNDTLYRIHGTIEPYTIGQSVSSGCIRMINQDAIDLYNRVPIGTEVKVLPARVV